MGDDVPAEVPFLTLGLFRIVAQDISFSAFTLPNDNLLCLKIFLDYGVSTACGMYLTFDLFPALIFSYIKFFKRDNFPNHKERRVFDRE